MSKVYMSAPTPITDEDWEFYLQQSPIDYIYSIVDSLKNENRFFVDERFIKLLYTFAFSHGSWYQFQKTILAESNPIFYRARKYEEKDYNERLNNPEKYGVFQGYNAKDSFVPPPEKKSKAGRINPDDIRYLYTSSDKETSILEARVQPGEYVSIASIRLLDKVLMFDLTRNYSALDASTLEKAKWINSFVLHLAAFFQKPYVDNGTYYFCQYISEYMKNWGFDGIMFRSSMHPTKGWGNDGVNYTFFNYVKCEVQSSKLYHVLRATVETAPRLEESK